MSRFWIVIYMLTISVCLTVQLSPNKCQIFPKEKHCLIEYRVRDRWPHQIRYVFNWYTRSCFEVRWSAHCPPVPDLPATNNFPSERACLHHCQGWA